jgi:hypothetical protein
MISISRRSDLMALMWYLRMLFLNVRFPFLLDIMNTAKPFVSRASSVVSGSASQVGGAAPVRESSGRAAFIPNLGNASFGPSLSFGGVYPAAAADYPGFARRASPADAPQSAMFDSAPPAAGGGMQGNMDRFAPPAQGAAWGHMQRGSDPFAFPAQGAAMGQMQGGSGGYAPPAQGAAMGQKRAEFSPSAPAPPVDARMQSFLRDSRAVADENSRPVPPSGLQSISEKRPTDSIRESPGGSSAVDDGRLAAAEEYGKSLKIQRDSLVHQVSNEQAKIKVLEFENADLKKQVFELKSRTPDQLLRQNKALITENQLLKDAISRFQQAYMNYTMSMTPLMYGLQGLAVPPESNPALNAGMHGSIDTSRDENSETSVVERAFASEKKKAASVDSFDPERPPLVSDELPSVTEGMSKLVVKDQSVKTEADGLVEAEMSPSSPAKAGRVDSLEGMQSSTLSRQSMVAIDPSARIEELSAMPYNLSCLKELIGMVELKGLVPVLARVQTSADLVKLVVLDILRVFGEYGKVCQKIPEDFTVTNGVVHAWLNNLAIANPVTSEQKLQFESDFKKFASDQSQFKYQMVPFEHPLKVLQKFEKTSIDRVKLFNQCTVHYIYWDTELSKRLLAHLVAKNMVTAPEAAAA